MSEFVVAYPAKKSDLRHLLGLGIPSEVAIYALLSTNLASHEAAFAFIFEIDEESGKL